jgi:ABC-2 type transport system ATP-binding protein
VTLPRLAAAAAAVALTGLVAAAPSVATAAVDTPTTTDGCISSVPEPDSAAPVQICYTLFRPAGASASRPVPVVLHGHGWGGSRTTDAAAFSRYLDDGYGVLSFDQRGFGESGGLAHVLDPDIEGRDVIGLVDVVAAQDWVQKEQGRGKPDPVLGAIGGSYGGGYQFLGAFTELRDTGATRFDALAPEITWNDLKTALAPDEVSRSTWQSLLAAIAAQDADETVLRGFAYGAATGLWPGEGDLPGTDLDAFYEEKGPRWHVEQGRRLDVPVLLGQGLNDNLFTSTRGSPTSTPRSRRPPAPAASSSATTAGTYCPTRCPRPSRLMATPARPGSTAGRGTSRRSPSGSSTRTSRACAPGCPATGSTT